MSENEQSPEVGGVDQRRRALAVFVVVAVLSAVVGFVAGTRLRSSAEIRADAEAPEASLITLAVERRELSSTVVVRGDIRFESSVELSVSGSFDAEINPVVTRTPPPVGETLDEGDLAIEIGGLPVFVLAGELPAFRDLGPGQEGDDVTQLQQALVRLGFLDDPPDGVYGPSTEEAVEAFWSAAGYEAPGPSEVQQETLRGLQDRVEGAQEALRNAESDLANSRVTVPESQRIALDAEVRRAEIALADAREQREADTGAARAADEAAAAALDRAEQGAQRAADRAAQARAGTHPDTGEAPTPAQLAQLEAEEAAARQERDEARRQRNAAALSLADIDAAGGLAVQEAETALALAVATRSEALAPPDTSALEELVNQARQSLEQARQDLAEAEAEIGTGWPLTSLIFLPELPRRVEAAPLERGDAVSGVFARVSGIDLVIDSGVGVADRPLVAEGDEVRLDDPGLGIDAAGEISFLATEPGTGGLPENRYEMRVRALEPLPEEARGLNVRITIPVSSTEGEVLVVPLAALSSAADGTARVQVAEEDGTVRFVDVEVGLSSGGDVEIRPLAGSLVEGDRVVVGAEGASPEETDETDETDELSLSG